jgi:hypothetical protein
MWLAIEPCLTREPVCLVSRVLLGIAKYIYVHILKRALLEDPVNETLFTMVQMHNKYRPINPGLVNQIMPYLAYHVL